MIQPLRVARPTKMIDLAARDVTEHQWERELVENGRQAGATRIVIDAYIDPDDGRALIRVSDNGHGMSPKNLKARLRDLHDPSREANFGVGARLSTLPTNPAGVVWASRQAGGSVAMVQAVRERGEYGLRMFPQDEGRLEAVVEPDPGMLPSFASNHGTAVILYGDGRSSTWHDRQAAATARRLAWRYWSFGETIVAVRGWRSGGRLEKGMEKVPSLSVLLADYALEQGSVTLADGAAAHWHVLGKGGEGRGLRRSLLSGAVIVRHEGELYDRADRRRFADFGIYGKEAQGRVVLVIEPPEGAVHPNGSRSRLLRPGGRDLPWLEWGRSFVEQMPDAIRAFLPTSEITLNEAELERRFGADWQKRIRATSRNIQMRMGPLEGVAQGEELQAALEPKPAAEPEPTSDDGPQAETQPRPAPPPSESKRRRAVSLSNGNERAARGRRRSLPNAKPVPPENWNAGDYLDFEYVQGDNTLYFKTTGHAIERQIGYWLERANDVDPGWIGETVRTAYAIEMIGKIVHALDTFAGRPGWTDDVADYLSPRALTLASLGFCAVDAMIEDALRRERGEADVTPRRSGDASGNSL
jgi:histidine kinase/DNA gyrase B/HSP90-like ATPase